MTIELSAALWRPTLLGPVQIDQERVPCFHLVPFL